MSPRVYNFSAGPACLPVPALEHARDELLDFRGTGMSIMECSHRSKPYTALMHEVLGRVRELLRVPDNYTVFFTSGGATFQFSAIPLNLARTAKKATYIVTGTWSAKANAEAKRMGVTTQVIEGDKKSIPAIDAIDPESEYVYYCDNETIQGIEFHAPPDVPAHIPLVADMSSNLFSKCLDISKFGLVYGCAQKNFGPAGTAVVIVRDDLIPKADPAGCPILLSYKTMAGADKTLTGMYNTPPCFPIYMCNLVFEWMQGLGGLDEIQRRNEEKAALLYSFLDASPFWTTTAALECRSTMNIPFACTDKSVKQADVLAFLAERGLVTLAGHRSIPNSFRASIYSAFPLEGVRALVDGLKAFEASRK
eukprot:gnl/Chilomastix_cuspidata/62.p2 GENE.gnl/Chilomastix_cuspidata/62~~gnl/Chilomastix_cuspidata/62.p2  ORF type:complete len:385 (+),score=180.42 gnl/Chilomastix_cuspidata/62:62-1156(+)